MSRKVYLNTRVELTLVLDEGMTISEALTELNLTSADERVGVEDMTWSDHIIEDSK